MKFTDFATNVLTLRLTAPQRVLCLVSLDGVPPSRLDAADREIARTLFGDVDDVAPLALLMLVWTLGRGSGKTLLAAAVALWRLCYGDATACGPGDVPTVVVVAPRRPTARLALRMARALVKRVPALERCILKGEDSKDHFMLRRPDGTVVQLLAIAASRGGVTGRGFSVLATIFDESEFFASGSDFTVTDTDVHGALVPRMLPGGLSLFISTPWPVPTLTAELVDRNHGAPVDALVATGPSIFMRPDRPELPARVEAERTRDPENTAREFDCDRSSSGVSMFFDTHAIARVVDSELILPAAITKGARAAFAVDLGFVRDSSAGVGVERLNDRSRVVLIEELRPSKGKPLKPSETVAHFASLAVGIGARAIVSDIHYRESLREGLSDAKLSLIDAPAGVAGKWETFVEARRQIHEAEIVLPQHARLLAQLRNVVSKPLPGGGMQVSQPRRVGLAHGDIASAYVLAAWSAAKHVPIDWSRLVRKGERADPPTPSAGRDSTWGFSGRGFG